MRFTRFTRFTPLIATIVLAGCASHVSGDRLDALLEQPWFEGSHRTYGSWLQDLGKRPDPPVPMSDAQAREFSGQSQQLRAQAEAIRVELAREPDRLARVKHYRALRRIGDVLRPIERQLDNAGRLARTTPLQAGGG